MPWLHRSLKVKITLVFMQTLRRNLIPSAQYRALSKLARTTNQVECFNCPLGQRVPRLVSRSRSAS